MIKLSDERKDKIKYSLKRETRTFLLAGVLLALSFFDEGLVKLMIFMMGLTTALALATHLWRRLLVPYIDLKVYAKAALDDKNLPAAIVVSSVCFLLGVLLFVGLLVFIRPGAGLGQ